MRGYKPALDGIRALAVIAVLVFHGEIGAPGGFLGVSVFFTLSGYLITTLLLAEHATSGTISLRGFYGRRLRRLLPAALLVFALVLALGFLWNATQRRELPRDIIAALADVANWRFAFAKTSYQELFIGAPSPVAHFWSLAIEEQFYVVLPLVAVATLRRSRRTFAMTAWLLLAASIAATVLTSDRDLLYNGTHTRAAELLLGVVLALLPIRRPTAQRVLRIASPVALSALIVVVLKATVTDSWLYEGGLVAVGICSAVMIGGVTHGGPLARVLGTPTLAALGRVSYGLYLFHWPLFLVLTPERLGFGGVALFGVRVAASLAAALLSYRIIEQPIRMRRRLVVPHVAGAAAGAVMLSVAAAALVVVPPADFTETEALLEQGASGEVIVFTPNVPAAPVVASGEGASGVVGNAAPDVAAPDVAAPDVAEADVTVPGAVDDAIEPAQVDDTDDADAAGATGPRDTVAEPDVALAPVSVEASTTTSTTLPPPTRVLVVGSDESPVATLGGRGHEVIDAVQRGCPIATAVELRMPDGTLRSTAMCEPSAAQWARAVAEAAPDVVVVSAGLLDRATSRGFGDEDFAAPKDLVAAARRLDAEEADLRAAMAVVTASGADVWVVDHRGDAAKGLFDERLARIGLTDPSVRDVVASDAALVASIDQALNAVMEVRTLRVLVIGDSVSLNFARALADGVPGALDVTWAGENGCPFVRARAIRVAPRDPWEENQCEPFDVKLPPLLDEYQPDVVVMMVSLRELVEQRYGDDDTAHLVGDPAFTEFHDAEMAALVGLLEPRGIPLLVTDTPPIVAGAMATKAMADPRRIAAWNAQIQRWDESWPSVALLEYSGPLVAYEAEHGKIRADGVHPEIDPLTEIARSVYVPAVIAQTRDLQATS